MVKSLDVKTQAQTTRYLLTVNRESERERERYIERDVPSALAFSCGEETGEEGIELSVGAAVEYI